MLWFYAPHCHACYNVFHYVFDDCSYSCIIAIISVISIFVHQLLGLFENIIFLQNKLRLPCKEDKMLQVRF